MPGIAVGMLFAAAAPTLAGATTLSSLTLQNTGQMVTSSTSQAFTTAYMLPTAGTLTITVSDQLFPSALTQLDVSVLNAQGIAISAPGSAMNTTGGIAPQSYTWNFNVQAGAYSTLFNAAAAPAGASFPGFPAFAVGLFNDTVTFTPSSPAVPLPPAGGVLLAGTGALGFMARRRRAPSARAVTARLTQGLPLSSLLLGCCLIALEYCI